MNLVQVVLGVTGYRHAAAFDRDCKDPRATQERLLMRILEVNARTAYGKDHRFSEIRSIDDFQKNVPPNSYEDLEPYIQRAKDGDPTQLTADPPALFATTSGTTGTPKFIPITKTSRRDKSVAMRLWLYHAANDHPEMFEGQILAVVSPEVEGYTESGIPYGAESGHCYRNMPAITKSMYAVPYEVFALRDYESKYYTLLRIAAGVPISFIGTCNPSTVLLLAQKLNEFREGIIRDVRDGVLSKSLEIPEKVRDLVEDRFEQDPERADFLEKCLEKSGKLLPRDIWPELALIGCWKGGSVGLYLEEFDHYFDPQTPRRDWGYLASEVRGSVPICDEGCSGVLSIETNFFEFVRESDAGSGEPTFLTADQLAEGERYFVYPTTTGGLYRYEMNDIVEVTGFFEKTPLIEFIQKGKGFCSLTGEKLYEAQVCDVVRRTRGVLPVDFEFIAATPEWDNPPRYVFLVEETGDNIPDDMWREWLQRVDESLAIENEEYGGKRKSLRLDPPRVKVVQRGEFLRHRQKRVLQGAPDGQFKMLKLNPDLEFQKEFEIDRVVELQKRG